MGNGTEALGQCRCKANVDGLQCDRCKEGYFNFSSSTDGCEPEINTATSTEALESTEMTTPTSTMDSSITKMITSTVIKSSGMVTPTSTIVLESSNSTAEIIIQTSMLGSSINAEITPTSSILLGNSSSTIRTTPIPPVANSKHITRLDIALTDQEYELVRSNTSKERTELEAGIYDLYEIGIRALYEKRKRQAVSTGAKVYTPQ